MPSASKAPSSGGFVGVAYRPRAPKPFMAYRSGKSLGYFLSAEMAALVYARARAKDTPTTSSYRPQPVRPSASEQQIQQTDAQLQAQAASPRSVSLARMGECAPACRHLGIEHPASHDQVVDAIRRCQAVDSVGRREGQLSGKGGAKVGDAFDAWLKHDPDALFPAGMFVGAHSGHDNIDLRGGSNGSMPAEIKYAKAAVTLCKGVYTSTRVRQSWTAPVQDDSESLVSFAQQRSTVPSEIELMLSGAVYQILIVVPAIGLQTDVRWPVYITASAAERTNLAAQFAPPGPHPVPNFVQGSDHRGPHWVLALSRTVANVASLYTPVAYLV